MSQRDELAKEALLNVQRQNPKPNAFSQPIVKPYTQAHKLANATEYFLKNLQLMRHGSIIRWEMGPFSYCAVKVIRGVDVVWYTTATEANTLIDSMMEEHELAGALVQYACKDVAYVEAWRPL